jgi:hypothetical protein
MSIKSSVIFVRLDRSAYFVGETIQGVVNLALEDGVEANVVVLEVTAVENILKTTPSNQNHLKCQHKDPKNSFCSVSVNLLETTDIRPTKDSSESPRDEDELIHELDQIVPNNSFSVLD